MTSNSQLAKYQIQLAKHQIQKSVLWSKKRVTNVPTMYHKKIEQTNSAVNNKLSPSKLVLKLFEGSGGQRFQYFKSNCMEP